MQTNRTRISLFSLFSIIKNVALLSHNEIHKFHLQSLDYCDVSLNSVDPLLNSSNTPLSILGKRLGEALADFLALEWKFRNNYNHTSHDTIHKHSLPYHKDHN